MPPGELDDQFRADVRGIKMDGPCGKLNLVLGEEPQIAVAAIPTPTRCVARSSHSCPGWKGRNAVTRVRAREGVHERLWIDCLVPSLLDPSLVTPGRHVMTCFVQYLPGKPTANWEAARDRCDDQLLAHLAEYVPAVQRSLVASRLYTPADLESTFGITEGNIFHGDLRPDQLFFMRPLPAYARYATPIRALYLCGAGTHPGGGVTGAPGFNAAHRILSDLRRDRESAPGDEAREARMSSRAIPVRYRILWRVCSC